MPEFWYKTNFTVGSVTVDVFHIDTMILANERKGREQVGEPLYLQWQAAQLSWLKQVLAASTATWKIAVGHHPIYTCGYHGTGGFIEETQGVLDPLLRQFNVNMYFAGHDHSSQYLVHRQMHYIVSGNGGANNRPRKDAHPPGSLKTYHADHGFVILEICNANDAQIHFMAANGDRHETRHISNKHSGQQTRPASSNVPAPPAPSPSSFYPPSQSGGPKHHVYGPSQCGSQGFRFRNNDVKKWCSTDGCKVLARGMARINCNIFCGRYGTTCNNSWEDDENTCNPLPNHVLGCDKPSPNGTQDVICQCNPPE